MQVRKQQLELDMEQQTGSKSGKECVKTLYSYTLLGSKGAIFRQGFGMQFLSPSQMAVVVKNLFANAGDRGV